MECIFRFEYDRGDLKIFFLCPECGRDADHPIRIFRLSTFESESGMDCTLEICSRFFDKTAVAEIIKRLCECRAEEEWHSLFRLFEKKIEADKKIQKTT